MKQKLLYSMIFVLAACSFLTAQSREDECRETLLRMKPDLVIPEGFNPCKALAAHVQSTMNTLRLRGAPPPDVSPRDLQSDKDNAGQSVAAANQSDAVPALYPFALAGGSIGGTGSDGGTNALTTISLNPAIFFGNMDDPKESARLGRMMDFSVIVPLTQIEELETDDLQYLGVRARINIHGAKEGGELYQRVQQQFVQVLESSHMELQQIQAMLETAPDYNTCIAQFEEVLASRADPSTISIACGEEFSVALADKHFSAFALGMEKLVKEADAKYFGLDLRADFGDPTLGAIDSARGTSLFAGIGYGFSNEHKKLNTGNTNLNSRLGIRYKDMENIEATVFDIDGALGVEIAKPFQFQQIKFGFGFEFRAGIEEKTENIAFDELDEALETNYLFFRTSMNVPITPSNSFAVQYGTSFWGDKPSVLAINFNWKLLLED